MKNPTIAELGKLEKLTNSLNFDKDLLLKLEKARLDQINRTYHSKLFVSKHFKPLRMPKSQGEVNQKGAEDL